MRVLIAKCPHCDRPVEASIEKLYEPVDCPHCQRPFEIEVPRAQVAQVREVPDEFGGRSAGVVQETAERILIRTHPAIFRGRPFRFLGCLILIGIGAAAMFYGWTASNPFVLWSGAACATAGAALLLVWWIAALATTLAVTDSRTILRRGLFARATSEVQHDDIRNVQMDQSVLERLFRVGDIGISSSGQDDLEIVARSIPHPHRVVRTIRENQA